MLMQILQLHEHNTSHHVSLLKPQYSVFQINRKGTAATLISQHYVKMESYSAQCFSSSQSQFSVAVICI